MKPRKTHMAGLGTSRASVRLWHPVDELIGTREGLAVGPQPTRLPWARTDASDAILTFDQAARASGRLDLATTRSASAVYGLVGSFRPKLGESRSWAPSCLGIVSRAGGKLDGASMNDEAAQNPYGGTRNDFFLFSGTDSLNPVPSGESGTNRALGVQQGLERSRSKFFIDCAG